MSGVLRHAVDRYVVAGNPVAHSHSPFIHAAFAEATRQALRYDRLLCARDAFSATVRGFAAAGGRGCNVTLPFKFEAFALATRPTPRAELAGACNTLRFDDDGWSGDNTDGAGLVRDLESNAGVTLAGARVLLIGAGGAAAGALGALAASGAREVVVANRTPVKAEALVASHRAAVPAILGVAPLDACGEAYDVVVNASASSLAAAAVPVGRQVLRRGGFALDMMYGAPARPFLAWAERHGARGRDGLGLLIEQAAEAFFFWRGIRPATGPVLAALRKHVDAG